MPDSPEETRPLYGKHALLLGESEEHRTLLTAFNEAGCTVHVRSRDESALAALVNTPIDLILLDFTMPRHTGLTLALKLRHRASHPPIAAFGWPETRSLALAAGAVAFLEIPFTKKDLETSLAALLRADAPSPTTLAAPSAAESDMFVTALLDQIDALRSQSDARQAQIERMQNMKYDLLHAIAYELAAPFTPVRGYLQILQSERLGAFNDRQRQLLSSIAQGSARMLRTIDTITEFASLETKEAWTRAELVQPRPLLDKIVDAVCFSMAKPKHVQLRFEAIDEGAPETLVTDGRRLERLLRLMIEAAVERSPSGATVLIEMSGNAECLRVAIYDQGLPPRAEQQARMLDPFLPRPNAERFTFAEMELPIANKLAVALGGHLTLEAPPSKASDPHTHFHGLRQALELPRQAHLAQVQGLERRAEPSSKHPSPPHPRQLDESPEDR
ncbi:MAG: hybrid sensor histidine kinase/response regulator [Myxococcales bacterium]|jgi:signal transduction histidine kinase|nr:hybrid sensor histidine kinase/response regulator [Myxococcales bacterium]